LRIDGRPAANSAGCLSRRERGWGEGLQSIERSFPPHPLPLPCGEREPPAQAARPSIASCCPTRLRLIY
jgi:hypothetical protein